MQDFAPGTVGRALRAVPPGMVLLGSSTVAEAIAAVTAHGAPSLDPSFTLGLLFVRDADNRLLGYSHLQVSARPLRVAVPLL